MHKSESENPELLTASKQRHRISTIHAALDVPEGEREHFHKHMGHSKRLNLGTYQYPLLLLKMTKVGRHLQDIDEGARSGRIADIQAEGGDTHIMLSEERCPNSQVFPSTSGSRSDGISYDQSGRIGIQPQRC